MNATTTKSNHVSMLVITAIPFHHPFQSTHLNSGRSSLLKPILRQSRRKGSSFTRPALSSLIWARYITISFTTPNTRPTRHITRPIACLSITVSPRVEGRTFSPLYALPPYHANTNPSPKARSTSTRTRVA